MQYPPVHHDPSGVGSVYAQPPEYTRKRDHSIMVGPQQIFEQGHQDLQDYALGHRGTSTDVAVPGLQAPRVLHSPPLIPHQSQDTLNNLISDPSAERSVIELEALILSLTFFTVTASSSNPFSLCLHTKKAEFTTNSRRYLRMFAQPYSMHAI